MYMRLLAFSIGIAAAAWGQSKPHSRVPVAFEPNRGQAPAGVEYVARGAGYTLSLRAGSAELIGRGGRVTATLVAARKSRAEAEAPLPGVVNYLLGQDSSGWHTGLPTYARVRYRAVYPGIDVVYYGDDGRLEYDFLIAAGADPRRIRLRYQSARAVRLDSSGDLVLESASGEIRQQRPSVYQEIAGVRREVAARYAISGDTVRFELAAYDHARPLVIDPALTWATYFGSANSDSGEAVAVDSTGNIYVAGSTVSSLGDVNAFVAKLNANGASTIYTTVFPGSSDDLCHAMAVDSSGNVYVAGETSSSDFAADGTYITKLAAPGVPHVFISKLDPTGMSLVYSHYVAGGGSEIAYGLALDPGNNAYIVGITNSTDFPVTTGVAQTVRGGGVDAFVMKFDGTGARVYGTLLGGTGDDYGYAVAVDAAGNAFVTGTTNSSNFPVTSSAYRSKNAGGFDAFVSKLSPTGNLVFSTYLGGSADDFGNGIAVDSSGAAYVAGETKSSDFPTLNPFQSIMGGGAGDVFVAKVDGSGSSLAYSTYLGGTGEDFANAIALDGGGNVYLTGGTTSGDFPVTNAFQATNLGVATGLVAALDPSGSSLLFSSYLGGSGAGTGSSAAGDTGNGIAMSCSAGLVVTGSTASTNFPVTAGAFATTYIGGGSDAFVARIAAGGTPVVAATGVLNSASNGVGPVAPGSLVTMYGSALAVTTQTASSTPWGINLGGVSVAVNGAAVPIYYASSGQMNIQLPYETRAGTASVTVTGPCGASSPVVFLVAQAAPYIFQTADGSAILQNQDLSVNGSNRPAKAGSVVTVYLTGIGPLDHPVPTGDAAPATSLSRATLPVHVTVGNFDTTVQFLGLTPGLVGLAQANLLVPNLSPGQYPIVITIGGTDSNPATMWVN
jgi:uncharacterized protein (TIGR03437 family)